MAVSWVEISTKKGGRPRCYKAMADFRDTLDDCRLLDLGYKGHQFTWSNRQEGNDFIDERLDRFQCDLSWRTHFPRAKVIHIDARPILLTNVTHHQLVALHSTRRFPRFHFEEAWLGEEDCKLSVQEAWQHSTSGEPIQKLFKVCTLKKWNVDKKKEGLPVDFSSY